MYIKSTLVNHFELIFVAPIELVRPEKSRVWFFGTTFLSGFEKALVQANSPSSKMILWPQRDSVLNRSWNFIWMTTTAYMCSPGSGTTSKMNFLCRLSVCNWICWFISQCIIHGWGFSKTNKSKPSNEWLAIDKLTWMVGENVTLILKPKF